MQRVLPFFVVAVFLAALAVAILPSYHTKLGLDLEGGIRGEYQIVATDSQPVTKEILGETRTIIENRVNASGVTEPVVQTQGADRITVELPGATDKEQIRSLVGRTGRLDFIPIPAAYATQVVDGAPLPAGMPATPMFSGDQISAARPGTDSTSRPAVDVELKPDGARIFDDFAAKAFTGANDNTPKFAIVLDGLVQSALGLNTNHFGGNAQIVGTFTAQEVTNLVTILKFGSLPLEIHEVGFSNLSATLGQEFLTQTLLAGFIGIALVLAFMIIFYRLPGLVACMALLFYSIVVYALFRFIPVTLTLAGIAAFVLSVGMAVDANILIFERTKEELRAGKTLPAAIEAGFNRAWNSILDSNVSSLITATILYYFGTSTIRGFALVLIIGVLISMFTAITLSRMMLRWVVRQPWARQARLYGVREDEFLVSTPRARAREASARV
jgi:preprotein translocase subunit SecD